MPHIPGGPAAVRHTLISGVKGMSDEVFRWFVAGGVLLAVTSFVVRTAVLIALNKAAKNGVDKANKLADRAEWVLDTTERALRESGPKISQAGDRAVERARSARESAAAAGERLTGAIGAAQQAVVRADESIDNVIESTGQAAGAVRSAVAKPVREAHGIINGVRAALSTLRRGERDGGDTQPVV